MRHAGDQSLDLGGEYGLELLRVGGSYPIVAIERIEILKLNFDDIFLRIPKEGESRAADAHILKRAFGSLNQVIRLGLNRYGFVVLILGSDKKWRYMKVGMGNG